MNDLQELLELARTGDRKALNVAFARAYGQLHALARGRLQRMPVDVVLDPSSLVHECYLRLVGTPSLSFSSYSHFLRYSARVMRSIIVDYARKRHVHSQVISMDTVTENLGSAGANAQSEDNSSEVEVFLERLATARRGERLVKIVKLKCLAGLTIGEIATHLDLGERTIRRDLTRARALLGLPLDENRGPNTPRLKSLPMTAASLSPPVRNPRPLLNPATNEIAGSAEMPDAHARISHV